MTCSISNIKDPRNNPYPGSLNSEQRKHKIEIAKDKSSKAVEEKR